MSTPQQTSPASHQQQQLALVPSAPSASDASNAPDASLQSLVFWARTWNAMTVADSMACAERLITDAVATDTELAALVAACPGLQFQTTDVHGTKMHKFTLPDNVRFENRSGGALHIVNAMGHSTPVVHGLPQFAA